MIRKKRRVRCSDCRRLFGNNGARGRHWMTQHYIPPKPIPPAPLSTHRNFIDLVRKSVHSWGVSMTDKEAKSPSMDALKLGTLLLIVEELREIKAAIQKTRTIS